MSQVITNNPSSIQQILTEDGIFDLIKRLSRGLSENRGRRGRSCRAISHFEIYEILLKNPSRDPCDWAGEDFRLARCVIDLELQNEQIKQLDKCIQQLLEFPFGRNVLRLLLKLANRIAVEKKSTSDWKLKMFTYPPDMLDGSLFNKNLISEHKYVNNFHFNASPGSYLPLSKNFFLHHGVPLEEEEAINEKAKEIVTTVTPDIDWLEVARMGPAVQHKTWENLGHIHTDPEKPFLSEACCCLKLTKDRKAIKLEELKPDLAALIIGVPSNSFPFNKEKNTFIIKDDLALHNLPHSMLVEILSPLLQHGNLNYKLELFVTADNSSNGTLAKALQLSVQKFVILEREAARRLMEKSHSSLPQIVQGIRLLSPSLFTVAGICNSISCETSSVTMLEMLCSKASVMSPGRSAYVLYSILKSVTNAYFRILSDWLFEGIVEVENSEEFFMKLYPGVMEMRTRQFWTQGFKLLQGRIPQFLYGLEESIIICGKSVCLLKLCNIKDPLIYDLKSERPELKCCLQPSELAEHQNQWEIYLNRANQVCGPAVSAASQLDRNEEQDQQFFDMIAKVQNERLQQIKASQQAEKEAKIYAQQKLRAELQKQIEEVRVQRAEVLRKEREEEEERKRIVDAYDAKMNSYLAQERENIISHYKTLSRASERRLERTEQKIEKLKMDLGQVDKFENTPSDVNKNIVEQCASITIDDNANLPQSRKVPKSLPLDNAEKFDLRNKNSESMEDNSEVCSTHKEMMTDNISPSETTEQIDNIKNLTSDVMKDSADTAQIYNIAQSEAARNKAKILNQEYNLPREVVCDLTTTAKSKQILKDNKQSSARSEAARNKAKVLQHEWSIPTKNALVADSNIDKDNVVQSPESESMPSPVASTSSDEVVPQSKVLFAHAACPTMTASIDSAHSVKTDVESPSGPMSMSMETASNGNLISPSSAVASVMLDSKVTASEFADTPVSEVPEKRFPKSSSNYSFLSGLSVFSEPLKWSQTINKGSMNAVDRKIDVSTGHLSYLLRQSLQIALTTQARLVNQRILKLFLQDEKLLGHFHSLQQYFLLVDGEFARHITESLCHGIREHAGNPKGLLNFVSLDSILSHALSTSVYGSKDPNASRLSLGMRSNPKEFRLSDASALNCFELQYQVAWPLCLIITPDALHHYGRIFCFLLGLRRCVWSVDDSFQWLQDTSGNINHRKLSHSAHHHQLRLYRHEMANFIQSFHSYIMNVSVLRCWNTCKINLKNSATLDELYKAHTKFVKKVLFYCLLRQEASDVQKLLQTVIKTVLKFHGQLTTHNWQLRSDNTYEHPAFESLTEMYTKFKERTRGLLRHMKKIADRGYQIELYEFLHVLNMNDYYNLNL